MTSRSRRIGSRFLSSCLLATALLTVSGGAWADGADEAKSRFGRGVELYKEGDYRAALIEFRRAHELAPNYKVLYNIGQANLELSDYAGAFTAFRRYLDEGKGDVPADKRKLVEGEIGKLEARVARVTVKSDLEGADVTVDEVPVGKTPIAEPILVSAGRRRIALVRGGVAVASSVIDLAGGDKPTITLEAAKAAPTAAPTAPPPPATTTAAPLPPPPPPPQPRSNTPVYVGLGVTGAFAVGTGIFAILAVGAKGDLDKKLDQVPGVAGDIQDGRDKVKRFSLVADVLGGATIVAGGITTYLALRPNDKTQVGVGPTSFTLTGSF